MASGSATDTTLAALLGKFAQSPDFTWAEAKSAYGFGDLTNQQVTTALSSAGVPSSEISNFLSGKSNAGSVVNDVKTLQYPSLLESLGVIAGGGIAGAGALGATATKEAESEDSLATKDAESGATKGAASAGGLSNGLSKLASATGTGAVVADLIDGGYIKYGAIWVGLAVLGLALVLMGLRSNGLKPPVPIVVSA